MPVPNGPLITAVQWLNARDVLGGEASDFTPWLHRPESMKILGTALKLDDLTAVAAEHNVLGKRLDILATALDENGDEIPVCIENQYGMSDPDHLGRLVAYLAQQDRGRAVWVVEQAHDAYVAAVRFLNRTSTDEVGYYLVQVRFTHGAAGGFQVHFEVLAAPIAWERAGTRRTAVRATNQPKVTYLDAIYEAVKPALLDAGFPSMNTHARGAYLWARWPGDLWFRRYANHLNIRVTQDDAMVVLFVNAFPTHEANAEALSILQSNYDQILRSKVPAGSEITWHAGGTGRLDPVRISLPGAGYGAGRVEDAADWSASVALTWLELLRAHPINDLEQKVQAALPGEEVVPNLDDDDDELG